MHLALYTFGMFASPSDNPVNDGFHTLNDRVFDLVDQTHGLIARSGYADEPGPDPWGEQVYPAFYEERGDGWSPSTLSLWTDIEALFAFTYFGLHAEAFRRGREWFETPRWPPLVMWWTDTQPDWAEGVRRHAHLHENDASPNAFTFKQPFDKGGQPIKLNKTRIKALQN